MRRLLPLFLALGVSVSVAWSQRSDSEYRIGPEDTIQIQVWQRPDLSGTYVVDTQGNITLPLLGAVKAQDTTAPELGQYLERRFVVLDPGVTQVLVTVIGFNSRKFTVVGEVRVPGIYTFRKNPTLWDVLLTAGGETINADMSGVQVVREKPEGGTRTITVDLSRGIEGTPLEDIPVLEPGDSIIVPGLTGIGITGDQIQVLGAVRAPGSFPLKAADTVLEAVAVAGGHARSADLRKVRLARKTRDGATVFELDLDRYLKSGYPPADMELKAGDTITIPEARGSGAGAVLRSVLQFSGLLSAVAAIIIATDRLR